MSGGTGGPSGLPRAGSVRTMGPPMLGRGTSFAVVDGQASVEHHINILLEDISKYGAQSQLTASEEMGLKEAFLGLHYVWRMRIRDNFWHLSKDVAERLLAALQLFMGRTVNKGPVLLSRNIPSYSSVFATVLFCHLVRDVSEFRVAINERLTVAELRRTLALHTWLTASEFEDDPDGQGGEEEGDSALAGVRWTTVTFSVEEVRKLAVATALTLAQVLNVAGDVKELVDPKAHGPFDKYAKDFAATTAQAPHKALLAPKGQYWDTPADKVLAMFRTTLEGGLSDEEVMARREVYGDNRPTEVTKASFLHIVLRQLADLIVLILIAASVISAAMGDFKTCIVLGVVILINTVIGVYQEYKAEAAISALASLSVPQCTVVRNGSQVMLDAGELVPGDIVVLDEGASVPADLRLVQVSQLAVMETLLTGESVPMDKSVDTVGAGQHRRVNIGDRTNMAFQSTTVVRGRAMGCVVNTGKTTEIGRISAAIAGASVGKTPLQKKLAKLGQLLVGAALLACGLVVAAGLAWDPKDAEIIKVGVSLALSVIPEGLVAIVTLTMALGMTRMAKRNALVRQLPAVETLGSVTTVCSDKTGTITEGIMKARLCWAPHNLLAAPTPLPSPSPSGPQTGLMTLSPGVGASEALLPMSQQHSPVTLLSSLPSSPSPSPLSPALQWQLAVMGECNNSTLKLAEEGSGQKWVGMGDQTEVALKILAADFALNWPSVMLKRVNEIAFDSDRKRMSTVCTFNPNTSDINPSDLLGLKSGGRVVLSKGAPEFLLHFCSTYIEADGSKAPLTEAKLKEINDWCDAFSEQGLRTLALAARWGDGALDGASEGQLGEEGVVERDLTVVGLVALADPPRRGMEASIAACHRAGIRVVMITGDHVRTATSIARSIGILPQARDGVDDRALIMNGSALSSMTVEQVAALEPFPVVFSRVSPDNKLNIVKALQMRGDVAAMTGDGVNDAPAIRQADVGVAMGRSGTDITRQAADIILADDNFCTIVCAVEEGRKIYDNITKFLLYLLSCNCSEVVFMLIAVALGKPAPLNALMILYANIVIDIPPSLALGAEGIEPDAMTRPPRDPQKPILGKRYRVALLVQALSIGLLAVASYLIELDYLGKPQKEAQSVCFAVIFLTQTSHAFMSRSVRNSLLTSGAREVFLGNTYLLLGCSMSLVAVIIGLYTPGFNDIFGLQGIDGWAWLQVLVSIIIHLMVVEVGKYAIRRVDAAKEGANKEGGGKAVISPVTAAPGAAGENSV